MSLSVIWKFLSAFALTTEDTEDTEGEKERREKKVKRLSFAEAEESFLPHDSNRPFSVSSVSPVVKSLTTGAQEPTLTSVVYFRPVRQPVQPLIGEDVSLKAPVPVTRGLAGVIHAGFAAQIEDVLQGRNGQTRPRRTRPAASNPKPGPHRCLLSSDGKSRVRRR